MPRSARFWKLFLPLLLGALVIFLIGNARVALWDRDEPWYAQCTREMIQSGNWVVPTFLGDWRLEKPPLIYWCQIASISIFGESSAAVRLPSSLSVWGTAIVLALVVRKFTGDRRALWSAFIFCTCGLAIASAKFCITDALLMFLVCSGQACLGILYAFHLRQKRAPFWVAPTFWITMGLAGLTKGPQAVGMHIVLVIILALLDIQDFRSARSLLKAFSWLKSTKPLIGIPILTIVVAPWLLLLHQRAPGFIEALFLKVGMHVGTSMEGHGKLPGYHALLIFGTFFPWSLILPATVAIAWRNRRLPAIRFGIAAVCGPWLLMECVYTKLPFYVLPAFPALAFLTADAVIRCSRGQFDDLTKKSFGWVVAVWAVATLGISAGPWFVRLIDQQSTLPTAAMIGFTIGGIIYVAIVILRFAQRRVARAAMVLGTGMAILVALLFSSILPNLDFLHLSQRLADDLTELHATGKDVKIDMIGYCEPSLSYDQGGGCKPIPGLNANEQIATLLSTPPSTWPHWIVIDSPNWDNLPQETRDFLRPRYKEWGINYTSGGKPTIVYIVENPLAGS